MAKQLIWRRSEEGKADWGRTFQFGLVAENSIHHVREGGRERSVFQKSKSQCWEIWYSYNCLETCKALRLVLFPRNLFEIEHFLDGCIFRTGGNYTSELVSSRSSFCWRHLNIKVKESTYKLLRFSTSRRTRAWRKEEKITSSSFSIWSCCPL